MEKNKFYDTLGKILYLNDGGLTEEEYATIVGEERRVWQVEGVSDSLLDSNEILMEWERDEYRYQAEILFEQIKKIKALRFAALAYLQDDSK